MGKFYLIIFVFAFKRKCDKTNESNWLSFKSIIAMWLNVI